MFELVLVQKRHYSHIQSVDACTCARSEEPPLTSLFLDYEASKRVVISLSLTLIRNAPFFQRLFQLISPLFYSIWVLLHQKLDAVQTGCSLWLWIVHIRCDVARCAVRHLDIATEVKRAIGHNLQRSCLSFCLSSSERSTAGCEMSTLFNGSTSKSAS